MSYQHGNKNKKKNKAYLKQLVKKRRGDGKVDDLFVATASKYSFYIQKFSSK
jgi:hypothetical protein